MFNKVYRRIRGSELDTTTTSFVLLERALSYAYSLARGTMKSLMYADVAHPHFRARGSLVKSARYMHVGRACVIGRNVEIDAYGRSGIFLGDQVTIAPGAFIAASGVIREPGEGVWIGNRTAIGRNCVIWGQGGVEIGADCLLGPNVTIVSENHRFRGTGPIRQQGHDRAPISIHDDCWIGANVVITAGVTVGSGSVVAAGSIVLRSVDANSVVGGNPAKPIGRREAIRVDPRPDAWNDQPTT